MDEATDVFEGIKEASNINKEASSNGAAIPMEAAMAALDTPDTRPAPTRTRTRVNPDKHLGVILTTDDKQQSYAPLFKSDPEAARLKQRINVRKMDAFGANELDQIINRRMREGKENIHLYLAELPEVAYQLDSGVLDKDIVLIANRSPAWQSDPKYGWLFEEIGGNEGWAIGGKPSFDMPIQKFLRVIQKNLS